MSAAGSKVHIDRRATTGPSGGVAQELRLQQTLYASSNPTRGWLHCTRRDWVKDALRRHAPDRTSRAMEVGFGSGLYLPALAQLYSEAVALDVQGCFVENARALTTEYPNLRVILGDINCSGMPTATFDLILCSEVLEHLPDSRKALAEMYRLLRPGGVLVLSTPQPLSPLELAGKIAFKPGIIRVIRLIYREPILETGHINLMSEQKIVNQIEGAGFCIRERFKSGVYLPVIAELFGQSALRVEQWLEKKILGGFLDRLLWEQYYVAQKGSVATSKPVTEDGPSETGLRGFGQPDRTTGR